MSENKSLPNSHKSGIWDWQMGIILPDGKPAEYPVCPFCTTSPFREFGDRVILPERCGTCGAKLKRRPESGTTEYLAPNGKP